METSAPRLGPAASSPLSPLAIVLERLRRKPGSVVFDLDSTLLDNRPRQAAILREFGQSIASPAFAAVAADHLDGWDLRVALRNAGVPAALIDEKFQAAREFWRQRFFTSEYCRHDVAVAGAAAFVQEVARAGRVIYLTGRPPSMQAGTTESLLRLGFPRPGEGDVELLLKPDPAMHDDAWKEEAVRLAETFGPIVAAFDNEPTHINGYRLAWPDAICVRLVTDHSGRSVDLLSGILEIANFLR